MHSHIEFANLITIAIAFNLAYVLTEARQRSSDGFFLFFKIFLASHKSFQSKLSPKKLVAVKQFFISGKNSIFDDKLGHENVWAHWQSVVDKVENRYPEIQNNILDTYSRLEKNNYCNMSSICLFLGLYGIFVLYVAPLQNILTTNIFIFNLDILAILSLLICMIYDIKIIYKLPDEGGIDSLEKRSNQIKRRWVIPIFLAVCIMFTIVYHSGMDYTFITLNSWVFENFTPFLTVIVLFSPFIIYAIYFFCIPYRLKVRYIDDVQSLYNETGLNIVYKRMKKLIRNHRKTEELWEELESESRINPDNFS